MSYFRLKKVFDKKLYIFRFASRCFCYFWAYNNFLVSRKVTSTTLFFVEDEGILELTIWTLSIVCRCTIHLLNRRINEY